MTTNLKAKQYLILATSTEMGKTFLTCKICEKFMAKKIAINAIKPIVSGFRDDEENDSFKIIKSLEKKYNDENLKNITPWRFAAPLSPPRAAKLENKIIDFDLVKNFCEEKILEAQKNNQTLLIESAGGVMTPISEEKTFLDLADELKIPVLLIGGVYLGAISNILCAVEALKSRKVEIEAIIINDFSNKNLDLKTDEIMFDIENFTKFSVFSIDNFVNKLIL